LIIAACSSSSESVGQSSERLTAFEPPQVVSTAANFTCFGPAGIETRETSAVWNAGGIGPTGLPFSSSWLVGVVDECLGSGGFAGNGLARAVDSGGALTWTYCNFQNGCGPGGGAVPMADDGQSPPVIAQTGWANDPVLATTKINYGPEFGVGGDLVAYAGLATSNAGGTNPNMVVASISFDGGVTFNKALYVNQNHCNDGTQDQETATFDTTVFPPRLWVGWRWNSSGTYGACVQYFDVDPVAQQVHFSPLPPQEVQNLDRTPFYGVGGIILRAQNGRVTMVYSNTDHHYDCPTNANKEVKWLSVSSDDQGQTWTPSTLIRDTKKFAPCLANNSATSIMRGTFGFTNDTSTGDYYAAVLAKKDTLEIYRSTDQGNTWSSSPIKTLSGGVGSRMFPSLASDGPGRLGVQLFETDGATDTQVTPMFVGSTNAPGNVWDPEFATGPAFPIDNPGGPCSAGTLQCRTLGDYTGLGASVKAVGTQGLPSYIQAWPAFFGAPSIDGNERVMAARGSLD
jgi:hypothetical protein